jgi:hypothetical protein
MRPLLCLLGRHHWQTEYNDDRSPYRVCSRCHRDQTTPPEVPYDLENIRRIAGSAGP